MNDLIYLICLVGWIGGIVVAQGVISTLFTIIVPPYAWYLFIEQILIAYTGVGCL